MKALSVQQPWAHLLMLGVKRYETRSWRTKHRGPLLIHVGRTFPEASRQLCTEKPFRDLLAKAGVKSGTDLPRGVLLGTLSVVDCLPADQVLFEHFDKRQLAFGDFRPGNWAWLVSDPKWLQVPIPYTGFRGLFDVADDVCNLSNETALPYRRPGLIKLAT